MAWLDNLVDHWRLDEASGNRAGRHAGITLTDGNTVTQAAGKIGNAALYTAGAGESLSAADSAALSTGDVSWAIGFWVYFTSTTGEQGLVWKRNAGDTVREIVIRLGALTAKRISVGMTAVNLDASTFGDLSINTFYWVGAQYDAAANILSVGVNDVWDTVSHTPGGADTTGAFVVGNEAVGDVVKSLVGRLDSLSYWKRILTAAEWTELYNGGNGLNYPFGQAAAGALTSSAALTRSARKALAGALTSAGSLARRTAHARAGAVAPSGALARRVSKPLAGAVTSAAGLARSTQKALAGALSPAGALARATAYVAYLVGVLSSDGALSRLTARVLGGDLSPAGTAGRGQGLTLAGVLSFAGSLAAAIAVVVGPGTRTHRMAAARGALLSTAPASALAAQRGDLRSIPPATAAADPRQTNKAEG